MTWIEIKTWRCSETGDYELRPEVPAASGEVEVVLQPDPGAWWRWLTVGEVRQAGDEVAYGQGKFTCCAPWAMGRRWEKSEPMIRRRIKGPKTNPAWLPAGLLKPGWVAMDVDNLWWWYREMPEMRSVSGWSASNEITCVSYAIPFEWPTHISVSASRFEVVE